ncbi:hypothetical protein F2Q68_00006767 [Brassica cretica]|uniref:Uncharacterized protein n=1 Tax=Brassica cretica TaxID=69181 RepID=A0A8S9J917_BRACR|nr:hypothetical protein F2Q68_00006767 [Brassica cretica]
MEAIGAAVMYQLAVELNKSYNHLNMTENEGNGEFRKEEEQESHSLREMWPSQFPHPEEPLLRLCLPRRSQEDLYASLSAILDPFRLRNGSFFISLFLELDNWSVKAIRRKTTGTGRMRYLRNVPRRFKTGFREGTEAKPRNKAAASSA